MERSPDVLIVGGGVIGLAVAWRSAQRGLRVVVLEAGQPGAGASHAAAGMLAAAGEAEYGGEAVLRLGLESAARFPAFAAELEAGTGLDAGFRETGSLDLALDADDVEALRRRHAYLERLGLRVEWLRGSEARSLEPALAPRVRAAILSADDHAADPRALTRALRAAAETEGVLIRTGVRVESLVVEADRVAGVRTKAGVAGAGQVVVAAGAWTPSIEGLDPGVAAALRPVKGQILRLRGTPLVSRPLRLPEVYVVPRGDGRLVVGATVEERGFDETVTAGGVLELLRRAYEALPGVTELELVEATASVRPGSRDNAPLLGPAGPDGLVLACGHYRNGILLAPVTADAIAELLVSGRVLDLIAPFTPARFAGSPEVPGARHAQR